MTSAHTITRTGFSFTIDPGDFANIATWVARRIAAKPKNPILSGIMLTLKDGTALELSMFDFDISAKAHLEVMGEDSGSALVSGRLLAELVQTFPAKRALTVSWDGSVVSMSCGGWNGILPTMQAEDYPSLPVVPEPIGSVSAKTFAELVDQVAVATSKDESRPDLTGVLTTFSNTTIRLIAIDGYRAGQGHVPWKPLSEMSGELEALVPGAMLADTAKMLGTSDEDVTMCLDGNTIAFVGETITITSRLIGAKFKGANRDIRLFMADDKVTVDVADLSGALRRANILRDEKDSVSIHITADQLAVEVHESANVNGSTEHMPCSYAGEPVTFAVNPTYMLEGLTTIHGDTVEISVQHPTKKPVLMTPPNSLSEYAHMVSPIRRIAVPKS